VVHGDGNQTRDFVYVKDVVRAMVAAATAPDINQQVINVGSGTETPVRSVAEMVLALTNSPAEIIFAIRNDSGVSRMCADTALARKKLSFEAKTALEEGLRLTLEKDPRFNKEL
jgi:UDP-glucose 4-epimerase